MTLQGDLSTLDLADLLQNLEAHQKSGMLSVGTAQGESHLYFAAGRLTMVSYEDRPGLVEVLVACGRLEPEELERTRKKRRGSGKSLGEVAVEAGLIGGDELVEIAHARLLDEACELIASGTGAFTFTQGAVPRGVFDPEERRLGLGLPAGPLLLESARREDHWRLIREHVPSDSAHYVAQRQPRDGDPDLHRELALELDGSRSVTEAMARFPHRRFEAYQVLAGFVEQRLVRLAAPADLVKLAGTLVRHDKDRAWRVLGRGLEAYPQNLELLGQRALLAEDIGDLEAAAESLKLSAHLSLEAGHRDRAREHIERAKTLLPTDTAVWERSMLLAIEEGRKADATRDGTRLAELYRAPGLHRKAADVFEGLRRLDPESWELRRRHAHALAECGELRKAVADLERCAKGLIAGERYAQAREAVEEILVLEPANAEAKASLERIDQGIYARRRARRRRIVRFAATLAALTLLSSAVVYEAAARLAYAGATRAVSRGELIEWGRYEEASALFEDVRTRYPFAATSWFDARRRLVDLADKAGAAGGARPVRPFVAEPRAGAGGD